VGYVPVQQRTISRGFVLRSARDTGRGEKEMSNSLRLRAAIISVALFLAFIGVWHLATRGNAAVGTMSPEYAKLMGITATQGKSAMPGPFEVGAKLWEHLKRPFYDNGPNDKGLGIQLGYSIARVGLGYLLAVLVAIPLGFLIGMSPLISRALDPFIQVLKPISPLAWMPLALYTIKDSGLSAIFVIFICSVWPMLLNTAFGVAAVRKEWINVARTLEVRADHSDRHADFDRHRLARDRRGRNAGRRHRHRLLRLERVEQPLDHQCDHRHSPDRPCRHAARSDPCALHPHGDVPGMNMMIQQLTLVSRAQCGAIATLCRTGTQHRKVGPASAAHHFVLHRVRDTGAKS
jgi:ABC-type nitrate/sulfonate/bicarbonate transport system permease component